MVDASPGLTSPTDGEESGSSGSPFAAFSAPQFSIVAKLRAALREKLQRVAEDDARDSPWYEERREGGRERRRDAIEMDGLAMFLAV